MRSPVRLIIGSRVLSPISPPPDAAGAPSATPPRTTLTVTRAASLRRPRGAHSGRSRRPSGHGAEPLPTRSGVGERGRAAGRGARWGAETRVRERTAWPPRALLALFILLLATPAAFGQSAKTTLKDPVLANRFNAVSDRLVCQCGCQMILRVCNHVNCPSAIPMRQSIEKQLLDGKADDEIVQGFVDEVGLKVLSAPPATGLNLAAWVMPGFALLIGLFVIGYFASRWAAKRRLASATAAPAAVDPELQKRIESEIRMDRK